MKRKVIQLAVLPEGDDNYGAILALCDDGTMWRKPLHRAGIDKIWIPMDLPPEDNIQ